MCIALLVLAGGALLRGGCARPQAPLFDTVAPPGVMARVQRGATDSQPVATQALTVPTPARPVALLPEKLTTEIPLDDLLDAAERSADVEERVLAAMAAIACSTQAFHLAERAKGDGSEAFTIEFATHDQPQHRAAFTAQYRAAQAELTRYCADARRWADLDGLHHRLKLAGSLSALVRSRPQEGIRRQRHDQAVLQVLANPRKYSVGLDGWLNAVMPKQVLQVQGLSRGQQHWLEDELYARLTGVPPDPRSIRSLSRCAQLLICPAVQQLSEAEQEQARGVAEELERLIRQQRWSELFKPTG